MDSNSQKDSCPSLEANLLADDLIATTLVNTAGTVVEFQCAREQDALLGPTVIHCTSGGVWNDTLPKCLPENEVATFSTTEVLPTPAVPSGETDVEMVLVVLWVSGGLLLVSLLVLLICILRSHKKARNNSAQNTTGGQTRQGSVNPTFSNYDEIWTWVPIVTNTSDNCRSQVNPIVRSNLANQRNAQLVNNLNNLRLPSYSEAVTCNRNQNGRNTGSSNNQPSYVTPSRGGRVVTTNRSNIQTRSTDTSSVAQRGSCNPGNHSNNSAGTSNNDIHHYSGAITSRNITHTTSHTANVSVTSLSGAGVNLPHQHSRNAGSALQEARALVGQLPVSLSSSRTTSRPLPSAPVASSTPNPTRRVNHQEIRTNTCAFVRQTVNGASSIPATSGNIADNSENAATSSRTGLGSVNHPVSPAASPPYTSQVRQTSYTMYPVYNAQAPRQSASGIQPSSASAFSSVISRATVVPVGEGPPPYSDVTTSNITRTTSAFVTSLMTPSAVYAPTTYSTSSLESYYF